MLLNSVQICCGTDLYGHIALSCIINDVGGGFIALIHMLEGDNYLAFFPLYRWLCYCNVPQFCDSLPRYETTQVFGRTLLRSVFTVMRRQLLEQARQEKDKLPQEKRTLILTHFPK